MGNALTASRPYIIDEVDSSDEEVNYESALETVSDKTVPSAFDPYSEESSKKNVLKSHVAKDVGGDEESVKGTSESLHNLLRCLENNDFDGAQQVAGLLKQKAGDNGDDFWQQLGQTSSMSVLQSQTGTNFSTTSTVSSNVSSRTCLKEPEVSSLTMPSTLLEQEEQRQIFAQLDEDLSQFERDERSVGCSALDNSSTEILDSSQVGNFTSRMDSQVKNSGAQRRRSPSPQSPGRRLRQSGIPRYGGAQRPAVQLVTSSSSVESETEEQSLSTSVITEISETLPEVSDQQEADQAEEMLTGVTAPELVDGTLGGEKDNAAAWEINISEMTGRAKKNKKRSGIPSVWARADDTGPNKSSTPCSDASVTMSTEEIGAMRGLEESSSTLERKVLDLKRWHCISRPQYKTSCGISSVVSCWNYLYSTLGNGSLKPLTQETAMKILGFQTPFEDIKFGPFTGNLTLLRWFRQLNNHFKVRGRCYYMYKPCGRNRTVGVTDKMALDTLKDGLRNPNVTFIYHCHNHYMCPIGYDVTPLFCVDAYQGDIGEKNSGTWVLIGDPSRKHPSIHCKNWDDICTDLNCKNPNYFNIRETWKGVMQRSHVKRVGGNLHCIMTFQKVADNAPETPTNGSSSGGANKSQIPRTSRLPVRPPSVSSPSTTSTGRPEEEDEHDASLEDEEVGCENLESDNSCDEIVDNSAEA